MYCCCFCCCDFYWLVEVVVLCFVDFEGVDGF